MKKKSDIDNLQNKIDSFKKKEKERVDLFSSFQRSSNSAVRGFQFVIDFVSGIFIGGAIGYFIDILFKTTPWALVVFILFGGVAGVLNIYRSAQVKDKEL